jgi:hypothetical protein
MCSISRRQQQRGVTGALSGEQYPDTSEARHNVPQQLKPLWSPRVQKRGRGAWHVPFSCGSAVRRLGTQSSQLMQRPFRMRSSANGARGSPRVSGCIVT